MVEETECLMLREWGIEYGTSCGDHRRGQAQRVANKCKWNDQHLRPSAYAGGGGGGGETDCLWTCPSATTSIPNHSCNDSHNDNGNDNHNDNHIIFIRMSRTYNFNRYCTCRGEYNVLYLFKKICNAWYNLSQPKF